MRPIFFFALLALIAAAIVPRYMGQVGGAAAVAPPNVPTASRAEVATAEAGSSHPASNGVMAAKRAGMRCVAVPNSITARLDLSHADLILGSLADTTLPDLLRKLAGAGREP